MSAANNRLAIIYATILLDAVGIGLISPILPRLLADLTHAQNIAPLIGVMTALYATMQFAFSPALGVLSDNIGRRPVLLVSLAGAAVNYGIMAVAPALWMLLLGRAIAGITSANISVATAYITDVTPPEKRAQRFGFMNAMFGAGFIIGPVLGGVLGDYGVRLPFIAAALLNGANLLLAYFLLPESHKPARQKIDLKTLNPLGPLRWVFQMKGLLPVVLVYFIINTAGQSYPVCWAIWGIDAFHWNGLWIGLSLGAFGLCQMLVQAFLPGPAARLMGERWAVIAGTAFSCLALVIVAFARHAWIVFALMPLFALGGIGAPAFQAFATRQVDPARQGQLQGVLASALSVASIIAPLAFSSFYSVVQNSWPGAIWLFVAAVEVLVIPLIILGTRAPRLRAA